MKNFSKRNALLLLILARLAEMALCKRWKSLDDATVTRGELENCLRIEILLFFDHVLTSWSIWKGNVGTWNPSNARSEVQRAEWSLTLDLGSHLNQFVIGCVSHLSSRKIFSLNEQNESWRIEMSNYINATHDSSWSMRNGLFLRLVLTEKLLFSNGRSLPFDYLFNVFSSGVLWR